jgi:hypothetical protein
MSQRTREGMIDKRQEWLISLVGVCQTAVYRLSSLIDGLDTDISKEPVRLTLLFQIQTTTPVSLVPMLACLTASAQHLSDNLVPLRISLTQPEEHFPVTDQR